MERQNFKSTLQNAFEIRVPLYFNFEFAFRPINTSSLTRIYLFRISSSLSAKREFNRSRSLSRRFINFLIFPKLLRARNVSAGYLHDNCLDDSMSPQLLHKLLSARPIGLVFIQRTKHGKHEQLVGNTKQVIASVTNNNSKK